MEKHRGERSPVTALFEHRRRKGKLIYDFAAARNCDEQQYVDADYCKKAFYTGVPVVFLRSFPVSHIISVVKHYLFLNLYKIFHLM
ncbi:hypothetical protein SDC9_185340 [bioreactor metagenome]|uniref:Uncharacterized protein n=1 Tax=bioreactor metagenome TaxID=1076179 RepID=A0A645HHZ9_9ZZZZ